MNILKTRELYTLNGRTVWYVNYISIKLIFLKISALMNGEERGIQNSNNVTICSVPNISALGRNKAGEGNSTGRDLKLLREWRQMALLRMQT